MARRNPPRKVTYFEPVAPRLARNTIIESIFEVGRLLCQVLWTAACMLRKRWADRADLNRCILRSRRRTG